MTADSAKPEEPGEVTRLLHEVQNGVDGAEDQLIPLVYQELRHLAEGYMKGERVDHTLQPTALVHEAYLKLVGQRDVTWRNRSHFMGIAAQAMRRILVDHARRHGAQKRGSGRNVTLHDDMAPQSPFNIDLIALDEALERLAVQDPRSLRVVELRYFGGLGVEEAAEVLSVSPATVKRDWQLARSWLRRELEGSGAGSPDGSAPGA